MGARIGVFKRLLAAFVGVAVLGAAAGVFCALYLVRFSVLIDQMYTETTAPLAHLFSLHRDFLELRPLAEGLGESRDVINNAGLAQRRIERIDSTLESLGEETRPGDFLDLLQSFKKHWAPYKEGLLALAQISLAGHKAEAEVAQSSLVVGAGSGLPDILTTMLATYVARGTNLARTATATLRMSIPIVLGLIVLSVLVSLGLAITLGSRFVKPLKAAGLVAARISEGKLAIDLDPRLLSRNDEYGDLIRSLNAMSGSLAGQMGSIGESVEILSEVGRSLQANTETVDRAIEQVGSVVEAMGQDVQTQGAGVLETAATLRSMDRTIEGLDREIERQTTSISSASASVEEMVGNIASVAEGIGHLGSSFGELQGASEEGRQRLDGVIRIVTEIAAQSERLRAANATVAGIAFRTNLLAMNAAIEAAHAGQAGQGFAVVADEIRGLAASAASQSKEIAGDIGGIRKSIEEAVNSSETARKAFASVTDLLGLVAGLEAEINSSLQEQREGSRQALEGLAQIKDVSSSVRSGSRELREGSRAIILEMSELEKATLGLKEAAGNIEASVASIAQASKGLALLSTRTGEAIEAVEGQLACYSLTSACEDPDEGPKGA